MSTQPAVATPTEPSVDNDLVVQAKGLSREFDGTFAVKDLDLSVTRGTIQGLIGPSGSGKTTTVRMLTGVMAPSDGSVIVMGTDPQLLSTAQRQDIGYQPQMGVLYPDLSIMQNLRFTSSMYSLRHAKQRIGEMLELLDMSGTESLRLDQASGGMQKRVALAAALLHDPDLLFLDEPTSGLDPVLRQQVWQHLQKLSSEGRTIVVTTQIVSEATMCDRVCLIADARLVADGTPDALRRHAMGGEVIHMRTADFAPTSVLEDLVMADHVTSVSRVPGERRTVRVVVDDDQDVDELKDYMEERDVQVQMVEHFVTPFDDVFVALLENRDA